MSGLRRQGEWLEWRAAGDIQGREQARQLASALIGEKWSRTLLHNGGLLWQGSRLRLRLFPEEPNVQADEWTDIEFLYEDDFCFVADKPAGMKVHPTAEGEKGTLLQAAASRLAAEGQLCRPRHIHRLDEDTTGPVLFAKYDWVQTILDARMREKSIGRTYVAFVQGRLAKAKGRIDAPIGRDRHHPTRRRVSPTGESAVTLYERLETYPDAALVRLTLETGRTHQIRVHLSHLGHPLIGDALYGGRRDAIGRQALHGEALVFPHPFTNEPVAVSSPWPADFGALQERLKNL
ncbi:RluA family pseudouridine synthase [Paenibacillus sp. EPM92]|uniref:RluA family pseudouridine synthase n=1 Tax=Paenibacillus sp. EPM92 TaxID=1561195 RepID=UPI0019158887|nr:RluA family pseudouridine synthase [Paenibacillus sp. EPM92]